MSGRAGARAQSPLPAVNVSGSDFLSASQAWPRRQNLICRVPFQREKSLAGNGVWAASVIDDDPVTMDFILYRAAVRLV